MRIRGKPAAGLQLTAKVFQFLRADAAFQERAGVHPGRGVPLKINRVALEFLGARAEEMVEAHFVKRCRRSIRGNVAADVVFDAVRAHHHGQSVPADEALNAALQFLVAGEEWFEARRNGVGIRCVRGEREVNTVDGGVRPQALEDFRSDFRTAGFQDGIQRLKPFLNFHVFHAMRLGRYFVIHNSGRFLVFRFSAGSAASVANLCKR